jgi:hypothetical protein
MDIAFLHVSFLPRALFVSRAIWEHAKRQYSHPNILHLIVLYYYHLLVELAGLMTLQFSAQQRTSVAF